ncbi:MAG TPA: hypothetical protein VHQ93_02540 [Chitinophagaceae bacterium]|jgi:hypothetical protein|nr:hypothetical protein [Chitinophagaceae bacterium]
MAINKNHEFEELAGVKCAIVEKNASKERVAFLKDLLEINQFEVVVVPSPPPKAAAAPKPAAPADPNAPAQPPIETPPPPPPPETFTVGVTNLAFNPTNAIFGRLLRTKDGHIVTQAYWYQKESSSHDEIPYYEKTL